MIKHFLISLFFLISSLSFAQSIDDIYILQFRNEVEVLKEAKFALINGNTSHARLLLKKNEISTKQNNLIAKRYLAIIEFIEENFEKSLGIINEFDFKQGRYFAQVCHLIVLNKVLENDSTLMDEWARCRKIVDSDMITNNFWIDSIILLKKYRQTYKVPIPFTKIRQFEGTDPSLKTMLKMSLYINQHKYFTSNLFDFDDSVLNNAELREIISFMLFREYELVNAQKLSEDLDTSNAHNLKGNLYLLKNQPELAYAEFKLSFKKKKNSINALERLIPLAWKLDQEEFMLEAVRSYSKFYPEDSTPKVYEAATLVKKKEFKKAERILRESLVYSPNVPEDLVSSLIAYTDWKRGNFDKASARLRNSCQKLDQISCWVYSMDDLWSDMFVKKEKIDISMIKNDTNILSEIIKPDFKDPIEEVVYIDQKQIDELDNYLIRLP